jgi:hypothetical protein
MKFHNMLGDNDSHSKGLHVTAVKEIHTTQWNSTKNTETNIHEWEEVLKKWKISHNADTETEVASVTYERLSSFMTCIHFPLCFIQAELFFQNWIIAFTF